jgi:hypothetical protein
MSFSANGDPLGPGVECETGTAPAGADAAPFLPGMHG